MPRPINKKKKKRFRTPSRKARGTLSRSLFVSPALGVPPARVRGCAGVRRRPRRRLIIRPVTRPVLATEPAKPVTHFTGHPVFGPAL
jgi:hypothetical protein